MQIGYAEFFSRSHDAVIRVYDETGNLIETHEHAGKFRKVVKSWTSIATSLWPYLSLPLQQSGARPQ